MWGTSIVPGRAKGQVIEVEEDKRSSPAIWVRNPMAPNSDFEEDLATIKPETHEPERCQNKEAGPEWTVGSVKYFTAKIGSADGTQPASE